MTIEAVKRRYKDEWVLAEVLERDELDQPIKLKVLKHSKSRDEIDEALEECKYLFTYQFYTGKLPDDYAIAMFTLSAKSCVFSS